MTDKEKALLILEELDKAIQVDWNMEEVYLKAIEAGLKKVTQINKELSDR